MKKSFRMIAMSVVAVLMFSTLPMKSTQAASGSESGLKAPYNYGATFTVTGTHEAGRHALDFGMSLQTVRAMRGGTIVFAGWDSTGGGNMIFIDNGDGYCSAYLHLNQFYMTSGPVKQGDAIAQSGNTGNGVYHLHVASYIKRDSRCSYNHADEVAMIFSEKGHELKYNESMTSQNRGPITFSNASSQLFQDQSWGRANLKVCASNLRGNTVNVLFNRAGRSWSYSQVATSTCVTFWDLDGSGPLNRYTTYYSRAALNQQPNSSWPIPCFGVTGGQGLCDSIYRP